MLFIWLPHYQNYLSCKYSISCNLAYGCCSSRDAQISMHSFIIYVHKLVLCISYLLFGLSCLFTNQISAFSSNIPSKWKPVLLRRVQLAVFRGHSGIQAFINDKAKTLAEEDEISVITSGIPYIIVRAGLLQDRPGGQRGFNFKVVSEGCASKGTLSKEDAAAICVGALDASPRKGLIFEVVNGEEKVEDWKELFTSLAYSSSQQ